MAIPGVISGHFTPALWRRNTKRVYPRKHIGADSSWKGFSPATLGLRVKGLTPNRMTLSFLAAGR